MDEDADVAPVDVDELNVSIGTVEFADRVVAGALTSMAVALAGDVDTLDG